MPDRLQLRAKAGSGDPAASAVLTVRVYRPDRATAPAGVHSYVVGERTPRLLRVVSG